VLSPYGPVRLSTNPGRGSPDYTHWVALDAGRRNERVVLVELPMQGVAPRDADRAREMITQRLMVLGQYPNVQGALGSFQDQGHHFIVLRHYDGIFLVDRVRQGGPLPESVALDYAEQVLAMLDFFAGQSPPAIHGMLSPDTLVISPNGRFIALVNWSPAIIAQWLGLAISLPPPVLLPGFVAPELDRGMTDPRADLYSLGATLFYALTGPEVGAHPAGIFSPIRQINPDVSPPTEAVIGKALRQIPAQRYQDPQEMQIDIGRAMRGESPNRDPLREMEPIVPRRNTAAVAISGLLSVLLVAVVVGALVVRGRPPAVSLPQAEPTPTINPTAIALAQHDEGLSSGQFIFDTGDLASAGSTTPLPTTQSPAGAIVAEEQGAADLNAGRIQQAVADFKQAVQDDPSNAEAQIYLNDTTLLSNGAKNYITFGIAVSFGPADLAISRQVLRGVALAQGQLNAAGGLPGGGQVSIQVASLGPDASAAPFVASYFENLLSEGDPSHSVGVISFGAANLTGDEQQKLIAAQNSLAAVHYPSIVPVTTGDVSQLENSPYFFQLSPLNIYQGAVLAQTAAQTAAQFGAPRIAVYIDESNQGLFATRGEAAITALKENPAAYVLPERLANELPASIAQVAHDVRYYGINTVIYSGGPEGAVQLAVALYKQGTPVPIIASSTADDPLLLGQTSQNSSTGDQAIAQLARANERALQYVQVLALADQGEWSLVNKPAPSFFSEFTNTFSTTTTDAVADAFAIFSYDALNLCVHALVAAGAWTATRIPTPQELQSALIAVNDANPYQGISGRIAFSSQNVPGFFDAQHVPDHRSLVLKTIAISPDVDSNGNHVLAWQAETIVGGQSSFCVASACTSP
jgi:ABC-type branched-subunit amino acid transport system substrate-binding protein